MTLDELNELAARKLGILTSVETLSAEDDAVLDAAYASLHGELIALNLARWALTEDVPNRYADVVAEMLAAMTADVFQVPMQRRLELKSNRLGNTPAGQAERMLRRLVAIDYVPGEVRADYF